MIDLDFYAWREEALFGVEKRLLVPHSDPMVWETPINYVFSSLVEATEWRDDYVAEQEDPKASNWVLVHYTGVLV